MSEALDIAALGRDLASGHVTAVELTGSILAQIEAENPTSCIFISVQAEAAMEAAEASDRRRRAGQLIGPLDGMPVAIKDNIDVAGVATTDGTAHFKHRIARADAESVASLRAAGAVLIGKLNMHEGALGATTDNPFWGQCQNPLADGYTPGGSSGGSGAAVAAGLAAITLGTDTMGSVRIPAAYCGVWGLKPTAGLVSTRGLSHLSFTLDTIGPIAASAEGLRLAMEVLAETPRPWLAAEGEGAPLDLSSICIGILDYRSLAACETEVADAFERLIAGVRGAGFETRTVTVDGWAAGEARRAGLLVTEAEGGHLLAAELDADEGGFSDEFKAMLNYGRQAKGEKLAAAYHRLHQLRIATLDTLSEVDVLLMPTTPHRAFPHGKPAPVSQADFTALANISGCPALAFPLDSADGLPTSAQLVGQPMSEALLIDLAERLAFTGS